MVYLRNAETITIIHMEKLKDKVPYVAPVAETSGMYSESGICAVSYGGGNEDFTELDFNI